MYLKILARIGLRRAGAQWRQRQGKGAGGKGQGARGSGQWAGEEAGVGEPYD